MILALRTDKPEAELWLLDADGSEYSRYSWEAHRQLASSLLAKIHWFLTENQVSTDDLTGLIVFTGQGSFTGLRIGATVANALAYAHNFPIISTVGDDWLTTGATSLEAAKPGVYIIPTYDKEPNITQPKK